MPNSTNHTKVLVVDDEHVITDTIAAILQSHGYEVAKAYRASEAVQVAAAFQPDILLSDVLMPDGTGVSAALRIVEQVPYCKVLLISGQANAVDLLQEARAKGLEFPIIAKPVPPQELLNIVGTLVGERKVTILNVDDSEMGRYVVTRELTRAGYSVIEAGTGRDALDKAEQLHPDLILLDLNLPDISGFEVCRRIRSNPKTAAIPVVHLTNTYRDEEAKTKALALGADGYATHPIEPDALKDIVERFRKGRAARD